jgi:hypothetical protein
VTDATAIEAVLHRQQSAWNRGDIETFMAEGYWRSAELSFYSGGRVSKGFDSVLAGYIRRYREGGAETGQLEFSELDIDVLSADAAVVRGRCSPSSSARPTVPGASCTTTRALTNDPLHSVCAPVGLRGAWPRS